MADPKGFMTTPRETPKRRPVDVRIKDWREVYEPQSFEHLQQQAGRCMDCGIPFCHNGCPLGNLIPEWNDLMWRGYKSDAIDRLHATNNFPEFTGRLCPAPCETACVVGINRDPVTIKQVELRTIEEAFGFGAVKPMIPDRLTGKTVAVSCPGLLSSTCSTLPFVALIWCQLLRPSPGVARRIAGDCQSNGAEQPTV